MTSIPPGPDPVCRPIASLLELFSVHAEALCFPEVDHPALQADAASVRDAATEVERCEQTLAAARRTLDERRDALRARAVRGLAYARIYAQDDPSLEEGLAAIDLGPRRRAASKRSSPKTPRKTNRKRATRVAEADDTITELPFATDRAAPPPQVDVA